MSVRITISTEQLLDLVPDIEQTALAVTVGAARGVNIVAAGARDDTVRRVSSNVYLREPYVNDRVHFAGRDRATPTNLTAVVRAEDRPARLDRFETTRPNIVQNTSTKGKRKGNPRLGIPAGMKLAGVFANVTRGKPGGVIKGAFYVPFRAGNAAGGGGLGVVRWEGGRRRALHGPSIDQVARNVWSDEQGALGDELQQRVTEEVMKEVIGAIK